jgi:hypothetical protein
VGRINIEYSNPQDRTPSPFGEMVPSYTHKDTKWKAKRDKVTVDFTLKLKASWGVSGGSATDVPSATDAVVTTATHASGKKVYEQIVEDLTPVRSDSWRSPRSFYWSRALTERHEKYHCSEEERWSKSKGRRVATRYLQSRTVSVANTAAGLSTLLDNAMVEIQTASDDNYGASLAYIQRPGEKRAFADGRSRYKALANAVKRQGRRLEAAERRAARAAARAARTGTP